MARCSLRTVLALAMGAPQAIWAFLPYSSEGTAIIERDREAFVPHPGQHPEIPNHRGTLVQQSLPFHHVESDKKLLQAFEPAPVQCASVDHTIGDFMHHRGAAEDAVFHEICQGKDLVYYLKEKYKARGHLKEERG